MNTKEYNQYLIHLGIKMILEADKQINELEEFIHRIRETIKELKEEQET